jgi:hypothetical protein
VTHQFKPEVGQACLGNNISTGTPARGYFRYFMHWRGQPCALLGVAPDQNSGEIVAVDSLRPTTDDGEPRVGETWERDDGVRITIDRKLDCACFHGDNGAGTITGCTAGLDIPRLARRLDAPPSVPEHVAVRFYDKDPGVGNYPASLGPGSRDTMSTPRDVSGWVFGAAKPGFDDGYYRTRPYEGSGVCAWAVDWSTVPAPADHAKCPEPVATPTPKSDPYQRDLNDPAILATADSRIANEKRFAKRARFTADTLADFDRPLLKLGGRFGRRVPATSPWDSDDVDEVF